MKITRRTTPKDTAGALALGLGGFNLETRAAAQSPRSSAAAT